MNAGTEISNGSLECGIMRNENGEPFLVFSITDDKDDLIVPPAVLGYQSVQELVMIMADFLTEAESFYDED